MTRGLVPLVLVALVALGLAGCGDGPPPVPSVSSGSTGPVTPQALAAVAAEHAGVPDSAGPEQDAAEEFPSGGVGAELRYGSGGEDDGDVLVVATGSRLDPALLDCGGARARSLAGCVRTDQGVLQWEAEAPEEDPGVVYVVVDKGRTSALLFYAGPAITGDPRGLDLPIPVDTLFAIATDPRVDVTTTTRTIEAGARLPYWDDAG